MWKEKYRNSNNKFHREDGPAVVHCSGRVAFYLDGKQFEDFDKWCHKAGMSDEDAVLNKMKYYSSIIPIPSGKRAGLE